MSKRAPCLLALLPALAACAGAGGSKDPEPAFSLSLEVVVPPYQEAWACWVGPLPSGDEPVAVRAIESTQTPGMHHMDLAAIDFVPVAIEPGMHDCSDLYRNVPELMEDALTLYGAQGAEYQRFDLPEGTAAVIPAGLDVLLEIHFVNASDQPVTARTRIDAYSMPIEDVKERIWGTVVRDTDLSIPAFSRTTEWTRCTMTDDADILFLSSHTHALGKRFTVRRFDGADAGEEVYVNEDWQTPAIASFLDAPLKVPAGSGFEFRCDFENPTEADVQWGFTAADEMCQIAYVFTPGDMTLDCKVVDSGRETHPL